MKCSKCGERWYLPGQMQATLALAARIIREEHGLFDPERIRSLRRRYGWTQSDLERVLNVGPKTVVRWERGTVVPGSATNTLMEVLESSPQEAERLSIKRGVDFGKIPPTASWSVADQEAMTVFSPLIATWLSDFRLQSALFSLVSSELFLSAEEPDDALQGVA